MYNIEDVFRNGKLNFHKFSRSVLCDHTIKEMITKKGLLINGLKEGCIQPNSVDLTLSNTVARMKPNDAFGLIDLKKEIMYETDTFDDHIIIKPKEFLLLSTNEELIIPNGILAFVCGRSSIARAGIVTESAGLVDSGFRGHITAEIYNQTEYPIKMYRNMRFMQAYFLKAEEAIVPYGSEKNSKYNGQNVATGSRIHLDKELQ